MPWLKRWWRARGEKRAALRIWQAHGQDGLPGLKESIGQLASPIQPGVFANLGLRFANEEDPLSAMACLREATRLDPRRDDAHLLLAKLEAAAGLRTEAMARYRDLCHRYPLAVPIACALADLYFGDERWEDVVAVLSPLSARLSASATLTLAKSLFALGRMEDVVSRLGPLGEDLRRQLRGFLSRDEWQQAKDEFDEVATLYADAFAHTQGREGVIESPLLGKDLNTRSGVNYQLLGEARMAGDLSWEVDTRLRDVAETQTFAQTLKATGQTARGLCHQGVAWLRQGKLTDAKACFEQARDLDDSNFAAYLGLGATLDRDAGSARLGSLLARAGNPKPCAGLVDVVTDFPVLTADEQRIACLATAPLAGLVPFIAAAKGLARILPIDTRPMDLPEIAAADDDGDDRDPWDQRTATAITGLATAKICAVKIETFLGITDGRWIFAHEFAHLAHFHSPAAIQAKIEEHYQRLLAEEHLLTVYETKNSAEFFAVGYEDYLAHLWNLPRVREGEDEAPVRDLFAFFDTLANPIPDR